MANGSKAIRGAVKYMCVFGLLYLLGHTIIVFVSSTVVRNISLG
jgi:hypothetical protein